jgi:hypothetical protein
MSYPDPYRHVELYYKLFELQRAEKSMAKALTDFEDQLAKDTQLTELRDELKQLGYTFKRLHGTHDGLGDEYVQVEYNDETVIGGADRTSAAHRSYIEAFVAGHARAKGLR